MSLILKKPRTADIKALADSSLLIIPGELDEISECIPIFLRS
ncbi:MAG: hypothetical protein FD143_901 [Ignavibacteria bacterium]|nr:MAG: hypothetical protein FD143_901 [Ignavibacteria bacterium]KAF0161145.1 MAG: hypothetical protein FD188_1056 [Ignavibacteria bacterium]